MRISFVFVIIVFLSLVPTVVIGAEYVDSTDVTVQLGEPSQSSSQVASLQLAQNTLLQRTASYLAELSKRRRLSAIFPNHQTPFNGVQVGYTNVRTGNLTFLTRDLVRLDNIPIVFGRIYDSRIAANNDFGPGWRLALSETIKRKGDKLEYIDSSGSTIHLGVQDDRVISEHPVISNVLGGKIFKREIYLDYQGFTKQFQFKAGLFRLTRVDDRYGNHILLKYSRGKLSEVHTSGGRTVIVNRNQSGKVVSSTDDAGRQVEYEYDAYERLREVRGLSHGVWKYSYNTENTLIAIVDPRGETELTANYSNRRVSQVSIRGDHYQFRYGAKSTSVVNAIGRSALFRFHATGLTIGVDDFAGTSTSLQLGDDLSLASVIVDGQTLLELEPIAADGWSDVVSYDNAVRNVYSRKYSGGMLIEVQLNGESIAKYQYDSSRRITSASDANGEREYGYGPSGGLRSIYTDGVKVDIDRSRNGIVTGLRTSNQEEIKIQRDAADRPTHIQIVANGITYSQEIENQPNGLRSHSAYSPSGASIEFDYDEVGNLRSIEFGDRSGTTRRDTYVAGTGNRIDRIIGQTGHDISFEYSETGLPSRIYQGNRKAELNYDDLGRLTEVHRDGEPEFFIDYDTHSLGVVELADRRTSQTIANVASASGVFGQIDDIAINRLVGTHFSPLYFDSASARFAFDKTPVILPDSAVSAIAGRLLIPTLIDGIDPTPFTFDKPSNALFLPPEFYSLNCYICLGSIDDVTITVSGSTHPTTVLEQENVRFDIDVDGRCLLIGDGIPAYFDHTIWYGDGWASSKTVYGFSGDTYFDHAYALEGVYVAVESVECSCNSFFAQDADSHIVYVECADSQYTTTIDSPPHNPAPSDIAWAGNFTFTTNGNVSASASTAPAGGESNIEWEIASSNPAQATVSPTTAVGDSASFLSVFTDIEPMRFRRKGATWFSP